MVFTIYWHGGHFPGSFNCCCVYCVYLSCVWFWHCGHLSFNTSCPLCFSFVLFVLFFLFVVVVSGEPKQKQGRGLGVRRLVRPPPPPPAPGNFIAGRPKAALLLCRLLVLYVILALWPPVRRYQLPTLLFVYILFVLFFLFVVFVSGEPKQKQGRGLVDHKLVQAPQ